MVIPPFPMPRVNIVFYIYCPRIGMFPFSLTISEQAAFTFHSKPAPPSFSVLRRESIETKTTRTVNKTKRDHSAQLITGWKSSAGSRVLASGLSEVFPGREAASGLSGSGLPGSRRPQLPGSGAAQGLVWAALPGMFICLTRSTRLYTARAGFRTQY